MIGAESLEMSFDKKTGHEKIWIFIKAMVGALEGATGNAGKWRVLRRD